MVFKMFKRKNKLEYWYKKYELNLKDKCIEWLSFKFHNFIYFLCNDLNWIWLDIFIDALCNLEVNFRLAKNKELLHKMEIGDVSLGPEYESWNHSQIPENDMYCGSCPFHTLSKVASFFYGYQSAGYCYYLNQGDFSFGHSTELLWDGCKECGINDFIEDEVDNINIQELVQNLQKEIDYGKTPEIIEN